MITGDFLDYLSNAALELEVWGAPESKLDANAAVLAAPVLGEPLAFEGASPAIEALAAESAPSAGPKTITRKITAEDAQKQVEELTDKLTSTKEQLDDAQRALQVQANRASARERGLHDHIAESSSEAKTRKQELDKLQRENKSLLEERQELKARLEKIRRESEKKGSGGMGGSAACAIS